MLIRKTLNKLFDNGTIIHFSFSISMKTVRVHNINHVLYTKQIVY